MSGTTHIAEPLRGLAIDIDELHADPANARRHDVKNIAAIKASLAKFGQRSPVVVQRQGMTVRAGNGRLEAARELGWTHIAALVIDEDDVTATAFAIADNRTAELAEWDTEALGDLLGGLALQDWDLETDLGFEMPDLSDMGIEMPIGPLGDDGRGDEEDDVPTPPVEPVTQLGDVWVMGDHRVICGDSTDAAVVSKVLDGELADLMVTDPPYGVSYAGNPTTPRDPIRNDALDEPELAELMRKVFDNAEGACRRGAYWYATVPPGPLLAVFMCDWTARGVLRQVMVWVKDAFVLGRSEYHYRHELIQFGWLPGGDRLKNPDRTRDTVWEVERPKVSVEHPTMKPVELFVRAARDGSLKGDRVFDPFLGSGTTLIAAEQLGRICYGIELDPGYCDVIVARWENYTGHKAERIRHGA